MAVLPLLTGFQGRVRPSAGMIACMPHVQSAVSLHASLKQFRPITDKNCFYGRQGHAGSNRFRTHPGTKLHSPPVLPEPHGLA